MSNKYKHGDYIPSEVLSSRLNELAEAVTKGRDAIEREFTMRVPAELDRDADLVLSGASQRIQQLEAQLKEANEKCRIEYNLSPAMVEGRIKDKLIELGWTPPQEQTSGESDE